MNSKRSPSGIRINPNDDDVNPGDGRKNASQSFWSEDDLLEVTAVAARAEAAAAVTKSPSSHFSEKSSTQFAGQQQQQQERQCLSRESLYASLPRTELSWLKADVDRQCPHQAALFGKALKKEARGSIDDTSSLMSSVSPAMQQLMHTLEYFSQQHHYRVCSDTTTDRQYYGTSLSIKCMSARPLKALQIRELVEQRSLILVGGGYYSAIGGSSNPNPNKYPNFNQRDVGRRRRHRRKHQCRLRQLWERQQKQHQQANIVKKSILETTKSADFQESSKETIDVQLHGQQDQTQFLEQLNTIWNDYARKVLGLEDKSISAELTRYDVDRLCSMTQQRIRLLGTTPFCGTKAPNISTRRFKGLHDDISDVRGRYNGIEWVGAKVQIAVCPAHINWQGCHGYLIAETTQSWHIWTQHGSKCKQDTVDNEIHRSISDHSTKSTIELKNLTTSEYRQGRIDSGNLPIHNDSTGQGSFPLHEKQCWIRRVIPKRGSRLVVRVPISTKNDAAIMLSNPLASSNNGSTPTAASVPADNLHYDDHQCETVHLCLVLDGDLVLSCGDK